MNGVQLVPVREEPDLTAWHDLWERGWAADCPELPGDPVPLLAARLDPALPHPMTTHLWLGVAAGSPVAAAWALLPLRENRSRAMASLTVDPPARRRGVGSEAARQLVDALAGLGRAVIDVDAPAPWPAGAGPAEPLLHGLGARLVQREVRRMLDLPSRPPVTPAVPAGYRVAAWCDAAPEELVADLARLAGRMSTDAPQGERTLEPGAWDAQRYRDSELVCRAGGLQRLCAAVVHEPTGRVAGWTELAVHPTQPRVADQWDTIVDPPHRGRGLGIVLKAANLEQLARVSPSTAKVNTWNAVSNGPMVAVNERLGFRPVEVWTSWELRPG